MAQQSVNFVLSASFTADLMTPAFKFWADQFDFVPETKIAPFAQVFQQILDPNSELRTNSDGANIIAVRWSDFEAGTHDDGATLAQELVDGLKNASFNVPSIILLCPDQNVTERGRDAFDLIMKALANNAQFLVIEAEKVFVQYDVAQIFDALGNETGKIPYTQEAFIALGTAAFRGFMAMTRKPVKLFAVDCDNTLWHGVLGEVGQEGIEIPPSHEKLHSNLLKQNSAGRLLSLYSKNDEGDVLAALRDDRVLIDETHTVSNQINWNAKHQNIMKAMKALNLGLDSAVFLDDSTVECAQMRAACPEVQTVQVPTEAEKLARFYDHLWLFDITATTSEDLSRAQKYKDQAARTKEQNDASSLKAFFENLQLEINIEKPVEVDLERFSQLSLRTNQFNMSMRRLDMATVTSSFANDAHALRIIKARDRFGDYGTIGALRAEVKPDSLYCDLFLLSCRAMGRGIEHAMLRELGKVAKENNLTSVKLAFEEGPRNLPAKMFLEEIAKKYGQVVSSKGITLSTENALGFEFQIAEKAHDDGNAPAASNKSELSSSSGMSESVYEKIALDYTTASQILTAIRGVRKHRPELQIEYVRPSSATEKVLIEIWQDVLNLQNIGINDPFTDLGGKSIQLVQIHSLMQKYFNRKIEFTMLFEYGTIASLAQMLSGHTETAPAELVAARASKMRQAKNNRAAQARARRARAGQ